VILYSQIGGEKVTTKEMKEQLLRMIENGSEEDLKELAEELMKLLKEQKEKQ
jgi:hypothetical protein